jgi:hypothetical protein
MTIVSTLSPRAAAAAALAGLLLAPTPQAEARGQAAKAASASVVATTTTGYPYRRPTVVRDHRVQPQVHQPVRPCYRTHTHLPDGSCASSWSQIPGAVIRDHRAE